MKNFIINIKTSIELDGVIVDLRNNEEDFINKIEEFENIKFNHELSDFSNEYVFSIEDESIIKNIKQLNFVEYIEEYYNEHFLIYDLCSEIEYSIEYIKDNSDLNSKYRLLQNI